MWRSSAGRKARVLIPLWNLCPGCWNCGSHVAYIAYGEQSVIRCPLLANGKVLSTGKPREPGRSVSSVRFKAEQGAHSLDIGVFGARGIPSTYGGFETFLTVFLPELVRKGHRVTVYCRKSEVSSGGTYRGVERVFLPSPRSKQFQTLVHGVLSARVAYKHKHDVVFVVNVANAPVCAVLRLLGTRVVLNTDGQEWTRGKWGRIGRRYFWICARFARYSSSSLISDCRAMARIYLREFNAKSTVIPYCWTGIGTAGPSSVLKDLGLKSQEFFVVGGRLNPENNIEQVAEAYLKSKAIFPLVVLGTASYKSPVIDRLASLSVSDRRLRPIGHVSDRNAFAHLLKESAGYIHAHSAGGINPMLIEAMGCGAFVIALRTPFNEEALGGGGFYFDNFGSELAELVERVELMDREITARVRVQNMERALSVFNLSAVTEAHVRLFELTSSSKLWEPAVLETLWSEGAHREHQNEFPSVHGSSTPVLQPPTTESLTPPKREPR